MIRPTLNRCPCGHKPYPGVGTRGGTCPATPGRTCAWVRDQKRKAKRFPGVDIDAIHYKRGAVK